MYALKEKGKMNFICWSVELDEFEERIKQSFWNWRGCQSKDIADSLTINDYLVDKRRVKVTIEEI